MNEKIDFTKYDYYLVKDKLIRLEKNSNDLLKEVIYQSSIQGQEFKNLISYLKQDDNDFEKYNDYHQQPPVDYIGTDDNLLFGVHLKKENEYVKANDSICYCLNKENEYNILNVCQGNYIKIENLDTENIMKLFKFISEKISNLLIKRLEETDIHFNINGPNKSLTLYNNDNMLKESLKQFKTEDENKIKNHIIKNAFK